MSTLTILVSYTTKPNQRSAFINAITPSGILEKIRQEDGCLCYNYYSSEQDGNVLLLVEKWTSEEHQKVHLQQPHMKKLMELKEQYVIDTKVEKFLN